MNRLDFLIGCEPVSNGKNVEIYYTAHCLQHEFVVQAKALDTLRERLERTVRGYLILAAKRQEEPFQDIPRAPDRVWDAYKRATKIAEFPLKTPSAKVACQGQATLALANEHGVSVHSTSIMG